MRSDKTVGKNYFTERLDIRAKVDPCIPPSKDRDESLEQVNEPCRLFISCKIINVNFMGIESKTTVQCLSKPWFFSPVLHLTFPKNSALTFVSRRAEIRFFIREF